MNLLTRKLERYAILGADDRNLLDEAVKSVHRIRARTDFIVEGQSPDSVHFIVEGFACRYKITSEGRRQILAFLLPGDFCDLRLAILCEMDHSIATLSDCRVARVPRECVDEIAARPSLARALWSAALADQGLLFEWIVNLGARDARRNLAHLFCELLVRQRAAGLAHGDTCQLPLTQQDLADVAGLSPVHVNRVLQGLRAEGLISFDGKSLRILDPARLADVSGFDSRYLDVRRHRYRIDDAAALARRVGKASDGAGARQLVG